MKKIKSILCMTFVLIIGCLTLVACGSKDPEDSQTTTTITLAEAKTTIVNALKIEDTQAQALGVSHMTALKNEGNRNLFIKLNAVEISMTGDFDNGTTISGVAQKNILDNWMKYSLQSGETYGYYDGNTAYAKDEVEYDTSTFEDSYFGLILQSMDCIYIDLLFLDDAFASIYENTVFKTSSKDSYTLTMDLNMSRYVDYVMAQCELRDLPTEGLFGDGEYRQKNKDEGSAKLVINFDKKHNILGLNMTINSFGSNGGVITEQETKINIVKYTQEITEPQWVTDFLAYKK